MWGHDAGRAQSRAFRWQAAVVVPVGVALWRPADTAIALAAIVVATMVVLLLTVPAALRWCRWAGRVTRRGWRIAEDVAPEPGAAPGRAVLSDAPPLDLVFRRGRWVVVMEVRGPTGGSGDGAPLALLAPLLESAGVVIETIQWLQTFVTTTPAALPDGVAPGRTLLVLRIDPARNLSSLQARGGGEDGARRLVAVTVARATALLAPRGLRPRLLDGAQTRAVFAAADAAPGPSDPAALRSAGAGTWERRRDLRRSGRHHRLLCWASGTDDDTDVGTLLTPGHVDSEPVAAPVHTAVVGSEWIGSEWIRAGPGGRRTGVLRLTASRPADLDLLERWARRRLAAGGRESAAGITPRVGVDQQWPLYLATLPGGPPGGRGPDR